MGCHNHNLQHIASASEKRISYDIGGPAQTFFMVPKLLLSNQTYSYRSEYDILQVWLNIIDQNICIKGVKATFFSLVHSVVVVGFAVGE